MKLIKNNSDLLDFVPASFSDMIDDFLHESVGSKSNSFKFFPTVDVVEGEKNYEIHLSIPGLKKEDIKIDLQDGRLSVKGERKFERESHGKKYHTVETQYGSFFRAFYLPENANPDQISAEYKDGILRIEIPKDEKKIARTQIEIK